MNNSEDIRKKALEYGKFRHPEASVVHHYAFANVVAFVKTEESGSRYGDGPSMRELRAIEVIRKRGLMRAETIEVLDIIDDICYGPMTLEISQKMTAETRQHDDPQDIEDAERLLAK